MASTLDRTLTYEQNLAALHDLVDMAKTRRSPYAGYFDFRPLLITVEEFLRKDRGIHDGDERRKMRLQICSLFSKHDLETFYDLTIAEAKAIQYYLSNGIELTQWGRELLEGTAQRLESTHSHTAEYPSI